MLSTEYKSIKYQPIEQLEISSPKQDQSISGISKWIFSQVRIAPIHLNTSWYNSVTTLAPVMSVKKVLLKAVIYTCGYNDEQKNILYLGAITPVEKEEVEVVCEGKKFCVSIEAVPQSSDSFPEKCVENINTRSDEKEERKGKGKRGDGAAFLSLDPCVNLEETYILKAMTWIAKRNDYLAVEHVCKGSIKNISLLTIKPEDANSRTRHLCVVQKSGKWRLYDLEKPSGGYAELPDFKKAIDLVISALYFSSVEGAKKK